MADGEYRPAWARHVRGTFPARVLDEETGAPEPQLIRMWCEHPGCGGYSQYLCPSGAVRQRIGWFALSHVHRDPLAKPLQRGAR